MKKIKLFASCIPVKGAVRSIICDLQRVRFDYIPNSLYEFLQLYDGKSLVEIKQDFSVEDHETIDEYIDFLVQREYIFFTDFPELFPKMSLEWDSPHPITNSIIDFDRNTKHDFSIIIPQLTQLRCQALELRFFDSVDLNTLRQYLLLTNDSSIRSISLLLKYDDSLTKESLEELVSLETPLTTILIHSCTFPIFDSNSLNIFYTSRDITDETHCGVIDKFNFILNVSSFTESNNFNSCLNRKISIDKRGNIKNCPSSHKSFGDISTVTLFAAINKEGFKKLWNIKKDEILVCKDCEFRYMCTDCRVYLSDPGNIYSKPLKCNYDPYSIS